MGRGRMGLALSACCVMLLAAAAMGAAERPRVLSTEEAAALIGGSSGCDGNCAVCGVVTLGEGCGQFCFEEPGTICEDPFTGTIRALESSATLYFCDGSYPVGDPCDNGDPHSVQLSSYACTCQAGLCTADYSMPVSLTGSCTKPGCVAPAP